MAKEMRYYILHNYIVELEKKRIIKKINVNLCRAFTGKDKGMGISLKFEDNLQQYMKEDDFSITNVDEHVGTIMIDLKKTAT